MKCWKTMLSGYARRTISLQDFLRAVRVIVLLMLMSWKYELLGQYILLLCFPSTYLWAISKILIIFSVPFPPSFSQYFNIFCSQVRLEHILERIALISDAANTEKPSLVLGGQFIGGALAARSVHTLQHIGITHILCLCSNEIGQSDSQYPELFEYKNFCVSILLCLFCPNQVGFPRSTSGCAPFWV